MTAPCTCTAPFGVPVVPLVKCRIAGSSAEVGATWKVWGALAISSASGWVSAGGSPVTSTCSSPGNSSRARATLRSYSVGVVTSTLASPRRSRCTTGSGPNAENRGHTTAPTFHAPNAATYSSGTRPSSRNTVSPRRTPRAVSTPANRLLAAASSA